MGHRALQRVVVRMLYDPSFVAAVGKNPDEALAGISLRAEEIAWLQEVDPRAYGVDVFRCDRTLKSLLDEYPLSGSFIFRRDKNLRGLATFYGAPEFHGAIQEREFLALAFGDFLKRYAAGWGAPVEPLVALEGAMAALRRQASGAKVGAGDYVLASNVRLHEGHGGVLALSRELGLRMSGKAPDVVEALLNPLLNLENLPAVSSHEAELILMVDQGNEGGGISLEVCPEALFPVLQCAAEGCSKDALLSELRRQGADPGEDSEVLQELCDDGLLLVCAEETA